MEYAGFFSEVSQKNLFVTDEEVALLFRSITPREDKYFLILSLIACAGCRPHEAAALNHRDFANEDYTRFYIDNWKVAYLYGGKPRRDLKMAPPWLGELLKDYIEKYWGGILWNDGYIFPTDRPMKRKHMSPGSFNVWFARKRQKLGLMDVVGMNRGSGKPQYRVQPYSFRRWFATYLDEHGVDISEISKLMGHTRPDITRGYIEQRRSWRRAEEAISKIQPLFGSGQRMLRAYC